MHKTKILVVDDELATVKLVRAALETRQYDSLAVMDGVQALKAMEMEQPDLVILDIMMPEMDGFEVISRLREWTQVPVIMLSARIDAEDKVKCLNLGADDYLGKPFSTAELLARVDAVLRRAGAAAPVQPDFSSGNLRISFAERRVFAGDREVKLTPTEYSLLQELSLNAGKVLTHHMLLGRVWGPEYTDDRTYLQVFIGRLRKKLEADSQQPRLITTVTGIGYRLEKLP